MCRNKSLSLVVLVMLLFMGVSHADEVLVWTFDEGSGGTVFDGSGNGRDGTINGATWQAGGFDGGGYALSFEGGTSGEEADAGN